jgi:hypothetical protein
MSSRPSTCCQGVVLLSRLDHEVARRAKVRKKKIGRVVVMRSKVRGKLMMRVERQRAKS